MAFDLLLLLKYFYNTRVKNDPLFKHTGGVQPTCEHKQKQSITFSKNGAPLGKVNRKRGC